jgi:hypothetical protein
MSRIACLTSAFATAVLIAGCGPLQRPMVARLGEEGQKKIDESWEKALAPVNQLDHQTLLDVFITTGAYQLGVDKVYFCSEKRFSKGLVIMEIHYDRAAPAVDRFEVKVLDNAGKIVRQERYTRDEVQKTTEDLNVFLPDPAKDEKEPPALAEKRAQREARMKKILEFFPKVEENEKK